MNKITSADQAADLQRTVDDVRPGSAHEHQYASGQTQQFEDRTTEGASGTAEHDIPLHQTDTLTGHQLSGHDVTDADAAPLPPLHTAEHDRSKDHKFAQGGGQSQRQQQHASVQTSPQDADCSLIADDAGMRSSCVRSPANAARSDHGGGDRQWRSHGGGAQVQLEELLCPSSPSTAGHVRSDRSERRTSPAAQSSQHSMQGGHRHVSANGGSAAAAGSASSPVRTALPGVFHDHRGHEASLSHQLSDVRRHAKQYMQPFDAPPHDQSAAGKLYRLVSARRVAA